MKELEELQEFRRKTGFDSGRVYFASQWAQLGSHSVTPATPELLSFNHLLA
jgi:hypothetical protein